MTATRVGEDAARWITAAVRSPCWFVPSRRRRGISGPSVPDIPCWGDGDVDLDIVDDTDGWLREVFAGGDFVDPRTGFQIAFVGVLEPSADVFVDNEMLVGAAPIFVRADVVGGAEFDVIDPSRRGNGECLGTASVDAGGRAVGGGGLVLGGAGRDGAISSGDCGDGAGFASRSDGGVPGVGRGGWTECWVGDSAGGRWAFRCHTAEGEDACGACGDSLVVDGGWARVLFTPDVAVRVGACAGGRGSVGDCGRVGDCRGHGAVHAQGCRSFSAVGGGGRGAGDAACDGLSLFSDVFFIAADARGDCCQSCAWGGGDGDSDGGTSSFGFFFSRFYWRGCDIGGRLGDGGDGGLAVCTCGIGCEE
jgi:hypothetical protein